MSSCVCVCVCLPWYADMYSSDLCLDKLSIPAVKPTQASPHSFFVAVENTQFSTAMQKAARGGLGTRLVKPSFTS